MVPVRQKWLLWSPEDGELTAGQRDQRSLLDGGAGSLWEACGYRAGTASRGRGEAKAVLGRRVERTLNVVPASVPR